jgi:hypothetical protein
VPFCLSDSTEVHSRAVFIIGSKGSNKRWPHQPICPLI